MKSVKTRFMTKQFDVVYEASKIEMATLLKTISKMGFKPSVTSLKKSPK